jgi:hypothetical protein
MSENDKLDSEGRLKKLAQEFGVTVEFVVMALNHTPSSVQQRFVPPTFEGPTTSQVGDKEHEMKLDEGGHWTLLKKEEAIQKAIRDATTAPEQKLTSKPKRTEPTPGGREARVVKKSSHTRGRQRGR